MWSCAHTVHPSNLRSGYLQTYGFDFAKILRTESRALLVEGFSTSLFTCAHAHVSHRACLEVREELAGVASFLTLCGSQGLKSGYKAWKQEWAQFASPHFYCSIRCVHICASLIIVFLKMQWEGAIIISLGLFFFWKHCHFLWCPPKIFISQWATPTAPPVTSPPLRCLCYGLTRTSCTQSPSAKTSPIPKSEFLTWYGRRQKLMSSHFVATQCQMSLGDSLPKPWKPLVLVPTQTW